MVAAPSSFPNGNRVVALLATPVNGPAASGYQINPGDLVWTSGGAFLAANQYAVLSGIAANTWSGFRNDFAGISLSQFNSTSIISGSITVATEGIAQYPIVSASSGTALTLGLFVTADNTNSSGYYQNQQVTQASGQATGIGKITQSVTPGASGQGSVQFYFQATRFLGGVAN